MKGGTLLHNPGTAKITRCPPGYVKDIFGGECISGNICAVAKREALRYSPFRGKRTVISGAIPAAVKAFAANVTGSNKSCDEKPDRLMYHTTEEGRPGCIIRDTLQKCTAPKTGTLFFWGR